MRQEDVFLCSLILGAARRGRPFVVRAREACAVMDNILCFEAGVDYAKLRNGLVTRGEQRRLMRAAKLLDGLPLYVEATDDADWWKK